MSSKKKQKPIGIDFFAGAGGMSLGFEQAGFDVKIAVEIDPIHCATHEFNFPQTKVICQSIIDLDIDQIKQILKNQEIDVIFGGPPCQGFSLIGKRVLEDPRNSLVWHFLRAIQILQPKYFVMENVPGLASGKSRQLLLEVIKKFQDIGYQVIENYQILNAANYGVPQNRQRLFLLGARQGLILPNYPVYMTQPAKDHVKEDNLAKKLPPSPTVWDALQDLPNIEKYAELEKRDWVKVKFGQPSPNYGKYLRGKALLPDDYAHLRNYPTELLTSSLRTKHSDQSMARFAETPHGKAEPISRFYKLDPNGLCNTLRAGTASNRGAFTSPRPIHPFVPRCITVREAARLHSYPDWFRFHVTKWHGFRQIGNSVPPLLAKAIASEIINVLGIEPTKPEEILELGDEKLLKFNMTQAAQYYQVDPNIIEPRARKSS
jgi:DNA (cytosine-5)-methyltransferase 1